MMQQLEIVIVNGWSTSQNPAIIGYGQPRLLKKLKCKQVSAYCLEMLETM